MHTCRPLIITSDRRQDYIRQKASLRLNRDTPRNLGPSASLFRTSPPKAAASLRYRRADFYSDFDTDFYSDFQRVERVSSDLVAKPLT
ncbi:hypothetical protein THAOC_36659 [Thalassiosira oceanica]|uniref:Uncharacterized protein n=1 Tax=Thalassiosira oceanica TaxID=159749 RepID=K0QZ65_THAOC|nr:hypothetical protein THAOC_36659 [Thalassiosira oceanica]|eukprot:EJK44773.1 hypothetical protein THAOC_36659 [Thalassiosira oceanica]